MRVRERSRETDRLYERDRGIKRENKSVDGAFARQLAGRQFFVTWKSLIGLMKW